MLDMPIFDVRLGEILCAPGGQAKRNGDPSDAIVNLLQSPKNY